MLWAGVCASGRCSIEMTDWFQLVFGTDATLVLPYTMCCNGIWAFPEIKAGQLPSGTVPKIYSELSQTVCCFATARRPSSVVNLSRGSMLK